MEGKYVEKEVLLELVSAILNSIGVLAAGLRKVKEKYK